MGETEQIRVAALQAAIAFTATTGRPARLPDVTATADRIDEWIRTGSLPRPDAGTSD